MPSSQEEAEIWSGKIKCQPNTHFSVFAEIARAGIPPVERKTGCARNARRSQGTNEDLQGRRNGNGIGVTKMKRNKQHKESKIISCSTKTKKGGRRVGATISHVVHTSSAHHCKKSCQYFTSCSIRDKQQNCALQRK